MLCESVNVGVEAIDQQNDKESEREKTRKHPNQEPPQDPGDHSQRANDSFAHVDVNTVAPSLTATLAAPPPLTDENKFVTKQCVSTVVRIPFSCPHFTFGIHTVQHIHFGFPLCVFFSILG